MTVVLSLAPLENILAILSSSRNCSGCSLWVMTLLWIQRKKKSYRHRDGHSKVINASEKLDRLESRHLTIREWWKKFDENEFSFWATYSVWWCFSIPRSELDCFWSGAKCRSESLARHLVSVVSVHEVEGGGGRAAQGCHQFSLGFGTRGFCSAWIRDGEGGRWSEGLGGRSWGEAAQSVRHGVCVELDLRVVEVLFAIAVIGVPNTPNAKDSKTVRLNHLAHAVPSAGMSFLSLICLANSYSSCNTQLSTSTEDFLDLLEQFIQSVNQSIAYSPIYWESTMCRHFSSLLISAWPNLRWTPPWWKLHLVGDADKEPTNK